MDEDNRSDDQPSEPRQRPPATTLCPDCTGIISPSAAACPHCGAQLSKGWKVSDKIAAIAVALAIIGAVLGYHDVVAQDDWKRREFVAAQVKDFFNDKINQNVLLMLDYNGASIDLYPDRGGAKPETMQVTTDLLAKTLKDDNNLNGNNLIIRQQFEHFLRSLMRLNYLAEGDAVRFGELCPDLGYPIALLAGDPMVVEKKNNNSHVDIMPLVNAMTAYLDAWRSKYMVDFIQHMGNSCDFETKYLPDTRKW